MNCIYRNNANYVNNFVFIGIFASLDQFGGRGYRLVPRESVLPEDGDIVVSETSFLFQLNCDDG